MAGTRKPITVAASFGLVAKPSQSQKAVSGTQLYRGYVLSTNTFVGTSTSVAVSGYLQNAGVNPTNIVGVCEDTMAAATADSNTYVRFIPALSHVIFEGSMDDGNGLGTCQDTQCMMPFGLTQDVTNKLWYVDVNKANTAATTRVKVLELVDPAGTQAGRVRFVFMPGYSQFGTGS